MRISSSDLISLTLSPPVAEIELKGKHGLNILNRSLLQSLKRIVERLRKEKTIKVTIIHSESGKGFAAGADMRELKRLDEKKAIIFSQLGQNIFATMEEMTIFFIGVIDGYCIGGGFDLALACDLLLHSEKASFQHPGTSRGFITGFGGNFRLSDMLGRQNSLQFLITGKRINGKEMAEHAFSSPFIENFPGDAKKNATVTNRPFLQARQLAKRLSALHPNQIEMIKKIIRLPISTPFRKRAFIETSLSHLFSLQIQPRHNKNE
jgi:enoyl-CoA hydratase/carnithine racemase